MLFMVAEVDIRGWRTIWQCLHNVFFSTFASSSMTMRSYMQFITVILLQQILGMQGKNGSYTLSECFSTEHIFFNSRICFRWWGIYVWWIWLWLRRVNHCVGALWRKFKKADYCLILEHIYVHVLVKMLLHIFFGFLIMQFV